MALAPGTLQNRPGTDQLASSAGMLCTTLADLLAWKPVAVDVAILELPWKLQHRYQLSFCDALNVSAAKATGSGF